MENIIKQTGRKREIEGVVISNKMEKTVKVRVDVVVKHPVYGKVMRKSKVFFAHTEKPLNIGDSVTIRESRPVSKNIKWAVVNKD